MFAYLGSPEGARGLLFGFAAAGAAFAAWAIARKEAKNIERNVTRFAKSLLAKQFPPYGPPGFGEAGEMAKTLNSAARELKNRFEAANEQNARFFAVLNEASEGVLCVSETGRITVANKAVRLMLAQDEITGRNYREVVFSASMRRFIKDALESDGKFPLRRGITNLYPSENFYTASAVPITKGRREAVVILFDSTEFKKLETAQKDLITNISHEIRTPLTSIIGAAEQIAERTRADEKTGKLAHMLERNTRRLADLCSRIITLSELEDRRKGAEKSETFNLDDAAQSAANLMKAAADRKNIDITVCDSPELRMEGDRLLIENMLLNLIDNAVKYSPEGGKVEVIPERDGNGNIKVAVKDRGEGIEPEDKGRIFERFYRTSRARVAQRSGGSGLGLNIARQAAEIHGGGITVESKPGSGSVFTVTFPRNL